MRSWPRLFLLLLLGWAATPTAAQTPRKPATSRQRPAAAVVDSFMLDPAIRPFSRHDSLLRAAAANNVALAQRLLAHGAEVNRPYINPDSLSYVRYGLSLPDWSHAFGGETALHLAVARGHLEMTDLLLRHGANPRPPGLQPTPLCLVLDYVPNQAALLERLLATGLNPDSARCQPRGTLAAVIGYNADMRRLRESYRPGPGGRAARPRRMRGRFLNNRMSTEQLHPLRSDSLNLHLLQMLTAAGARPDWLALHAAIRSREPGLARYLLTHGVGPDASEPEGGLSALHLAVREQDSVAVQLLVAQGATLNAITQGGETPLHLAAALPSPRLVVLLLAAGAAPDGHPRAANCPDCRDGQSSTPLHRAVQAARPVTVRRLLAAGANPNACDADQQTPLHYAVNSYPAAYQRIDDDWGRPKLTELERVQVTSRRPNADEVLRLLLAAGASPNVTDHGGSGPLAAAVANGDTLRVGRLLRAGANPNQLDQFGYRPLHSVRSVAVLRQLQAAGGQFGPADYELLLQAELPLPITAAVLAQAGKLSDLVATGGDTPLHLVAAHPDADLGAVPLLLARGLDINAANYSYWTPLTHAVVAQRPAMVQLLLDAGARPNCDPSPLTAAARLGSEALVGLLLRYGAPVNRPDSLTGDTPLLAAVQSGTCTPAIAQRLLDAGANPNVADSAGYSPLHLLAMQRRTAAQRDAPSLDGWGGPPSGPPVLTAERQRQARWADARLLATGRLLLTHGAHPDSRNAAGESVRDALRAADTPACRQLLAELAKAAGNATGGAPVKH